MDEGKSRHEPSTINHQPSTICSYSVTSSNWLPSTVPSSRSSAIWSQYRFSPCTMNFVGSLRSAVSPECISPFARLRRSSGSRFALDLPPPTRERSSALFRPKLRRTQATRSAAAAASRATSARVNTGPRPRRCSSSLEQWLALRRGRQLGKLNSWLDGGFSEPGSCNTPHG